ncbi:MAG: flagellar basal-body MS-ring/collar protein FliF [Balneolaceae bacterium]|jgi:flagellar M-ring protein FliF
MARFVESFKNFFQPLTGAQKMLFVLFSVGILTLTSMLFYWALQPSYSVLFGSLSPESAQSIVEELKTMDVNYRLEDNGRSIMVPRDRVYDLRLKFASKGATGSDYKGYELFDQNTLGMTDFMQRINKKRAMEGELARTINSLSQVESSRIHIVLPERSPFKKNSVEPTASVILNLKKGQGLSKDQIQGIGALISGSVEGLSADNVVILDQNGNRISENILVSDEAVASTAHMRIRQETENYLTNKGQSMLDRVLGPGNSILRVSTEHNFDKVVRESKNIDPNSRIVISEEKRTSTNSNQSKQPKAQLSEKDQSLTTNQQRGESSVQVKNYEVNNTKEKLEKTVGEVTRISASILLNYKTETSKDKSGEAVTNSKPYSDEEIAEIKNVMSGALGIQPDRGDVLTVKQIKFKDNFSNANYNDGFFNEPYSMFELIRWGIVAVIIIVVSVMVYRMTKNFSVQADPLLSKQKRSRELAEGDQDRYLEGETEEANEDIYTQKLSNEAKELADASEATEEIKKFVENNTAEAASYVRSMMSGVLESD